MLKRLITAALTVCVGVAIGVLLAVAGHSGKVVDALPPQSVTAPAASGTTIAPPTQQQNAAAHTPQSGSGAVPEQGYYIRDYNGRVAVLRGGSEVPEMIFDIQTKMLPELDRDALSQGIFVGSYEEMLRQVEDYIS